MYAWDTTSDTYCARPRGARGRTNGVVQESLHLTLNTTECSKGLKTGSPIIKFRLLKYCEVLPRLIYTVNLIIFRIIWFGDLAQW